VGPVRAGPTSFHGLCADGRTGARHRRRDAGGPHAAMASRCAGGRRSAAHAGARGYGYVDEYPVGKYLRDARVTTVYEGTSQVQKLIIGRALTGESAFV
jgi:alkylation response protein AidB-like acyl-CoA dehydrogenase